MARAIQRFIQEHGSASFFGMGKVDNSFGESTAWRLCKPLRNDARPILPLEEEKPGFSCPCDPSPSSSLRPGSVVHFSSLPLLPREFPSARFAPSSTCGTSSSDSDSTFLPHQVPCLKKAFKMMRSISVFSWLLPKVREGSLFRYLYHHYNPPIINSPATINGTAEIGFGREEAVMYYTGNQVHSQHASDRAQPDFRDRDRQ